MIWILVKKGDLQPIVIGYNSVMRFQHMTQRQTLPGKPDVENRSENLLREQRYRVLTCAKCCYEACHSVCRQEKALRRWSIK